MGKAQEFKSVRRQARRALGNESFFWVRKCYRVVNRGFFGRWKWLLFGR